MKAQWDDSIVDMEHVTDLPSPGLPFGERLIRGFLLVGFVAVLLIEIYFVLQLLSLF